jgi:hypothetical protein
MMLLEVQQLSGHIHAESHVVVRDCLDVGEKCLEPVGSVHIRVPLPKPVQLLGERRKGVLLE